MLDSAGLLADAFVETSNLSAHTQPGTRHASIHLDARRDPRFKLETDIRVYSRKAGLLKGHTVDICEAGISAVLRLEVAVGELVQLEFELPAGSVVIRAIVRHKTAFRYGFQFVEPDPRGVIKKTCEALAAKQKPSVEPA